MRDRETDGDTNETETKMSERRSEGSGGVRETHNSAKGGIGEDAFSCCVLAGDGARLSMLTLMMLIRLVNGN